MRDRKGIRDLAVLLEQPGREVAALDLARSDYRREADVADNPLDELLDADARAVYRDRIVELQHDLDDADERRDGEAAARARAELDALVDALASATGLGGAPRRPGSDVERARKAVTARIGDAIRHLDAVHSPAAWHLRHAVRTGTYCAYEPEHDVSWAVELRS